MLCDFPSQEPRSILAAFRPSVHPPALRGHWSVSKVSWVGTSDMGMWGEAWLITPFEKWTPHFQLKLQEKAGSPDRSQQGNLREKGDLSVLLGHTGRAGWRVGRCHQLLPSGTPSSIPTCPKAMMSPVLYFPTLSYTQVPGRPMHTAGFACQG